MLFLSHAKCNFLYWAQYTSHHRFESIGEQLAVCGNTLSSACCLKLPLTKLVSTEGRSVLLRCDPLGAVHGA